MVRARGIQIFEARSILHTPKFGNVGRAIGRGFDAQFVRDRNFIQHGGEELRCHIDRHAHRDATRTAATGAKFCRRGIALLLEPRRTIDKVIKRIDFILIFSGEVPLFAVFTTAAHVRVRIDSAAFEKRKPAGVKIRFGRDAVRTVRVE